MTSLLIALIKAAGCGPPLLGGERPARPWVMLLCCLGLASVASGQLITEFSIPSGLAPSGITAGPDGALWFTEYSTSSSAVAIGRISIGGAITEYPIPNPNGGSPGGISAGSDGNLWFTFADADNGTFSSIARITPAGSLTEFRLPNLANPCNIVSGPDGNLWFTECNINGNAIGRITPAGLITGFPLPDRGLGHYPIDITAGPDGNLWFTEASGKIGRVTTTGAITEFNALGFPVGSITAGPDGNLWFGSGSKVSRISTTGVVTEFPLPVKADPSITSITSGLDGNLWFTEQLRNGIGRITTEGTVTEFAIPTALAQPSGIAAGPDGNIWFTEAGAASIGRIDLNYRTPCSPDAAALNLNAGRFKAQVCWRAPSQGTGIPGQALPMTANSGSFWFFSPDNTELTVKVLDGRDSNGKFWVIYGALSNVEFTLTMTDTLTGAVRTYFNPQGQMASVADTSAF